MKYTQTVLEQNLKNLKKNGRKAVVLFVTAGDPSWAITKELLWFAQEAGVDCIEIGVPFSDPLADGPVIQASSYRSVVKGVTLDHIFKNVAQERKKGLCIPIVLMSSLNPLYVYGVERAAKQMQVAGISGAIIPDLPLGEDKSVEQVFSNNGLDIILMTTPTTSHARHKRITADAHGFIYFVSTVGLTGDKRNNSSQIAKVIQSTTRSTTNSVLVGFGINDAKGAKQFAKISDGIIIGSALVKQLYESKAKHLSPKIKHWITDIVSAVKGPTRHV
ncbi:MAG: tryptophan synthase alpha chain [Candidatus Omnitrophota bacterium]|jgi:tryptophan synthase alpha chain